MDAQPVRRVLLTGDTVGGVWEFTLEMAEGLIERGLEVCLATFGRWATVAQRREALKAPHLHWLDSNYKLEWMDDPWSDVKQSGKWLLDIEKQFRPDVVHLNTLCHGSLPWATPVVVTVHSCVLSWWSAVKGGPAPEAWSRYRREVERSLNAVHAMTAPSQAALESIQEHYEIEAVRAQVVYNGRDPRRFRSGVKEPFILAAGRLWDEGKNIRALAQAAPSLPWPIFLAGDQQSPTGETPAMPECWMLGRLSGSTLANWYARAAIYALPARYEPFGLSILEAAFSACALVLGDIRTLRELWDGAAIFVPPDRPEALRTALQELIENPRRCREMAIRAKNRACHFTRSSMVTGYLNVYKAARRRFAAEQISCAS